MTPLRMTVLGSGSVGLAIAATYAHAGLDVTVLARGAAIQLLRQNGITVTGVSGDHQIEPQRLKVSDTENPNPEDIDCDCLIVATKAYQVQEVLRSLMQATRTAVAPRAVLLLQNGCGSADEARSILPAGAAIFSIIMMIGIERRSPTHVNVNVQASPVRVGTLFASASESMLAFLVVCIVLAISATYELIEWGATLAMGQGADEFLVSLTGTIEPPMIGR